MTCEICEDFIAFLECDLGTSGVALATLIENEIERFGLSLLKARGQCYDGAGSMKGARNRLSSLLTQRYPLIIYFHCAGHKLNLCVALSCTTPLVANMMGSIQKVSSIFSNSPKKQNLLEKVILQNKPLTDIKVLKDVCRTRWLERIDSMDRILVLLSEILTTLNLIGTNFDNTYNDAKGQADASGQYHNMRSFSFIITLLIVRKILSYVHSLTYEVQKKSLDVVALFEAVYIVINTLQEINENLDSYHHTYYLEACDIANNLEIEIKAPRACPKNISVEDYFKRNVSRPYIDYIVGSLNERFSDDHKIHFFWYFHSTT